MQGNAAAAGRAPGSGCGPLAGLTVLDCGNFLAGPIVSLHLSAMGADVIKVEKPQNGDDGRAVGPFASDGNSSYHLSTNRGKRSVAIDAFALFVVANVALVTWIFELFVLLIVFCGCCVCAFYVTT